METPPGQDANLMRAFLSTITVLVVSQPVHAADSRPVSVTGEQLGKMLRAMGYEQQSLSEEVHQVTVRRDGWQVHTLVSLSHDGARVWLECKFPPVPNPEQVPASAWL